MTKPRLSPAERRAIIGAFQRGELDTTKYEVIEQPNRGGYYIKTLEQKRKKPPPKKNNQKKPEQPPPEPEPKNNQPNNAPDPNDEEDIYEEPEGLNNAPNDDYNPFNDPRIFYPANKMRKKDIVNNYQTIFNQMFYEQLKMIRKMQERETKKRTKIAERTNALYKTLVDAVNETQPNAQPQQPPSANIQQPQPQSSSPQPISPQPVNPTPSPLAPTNLLHEEPIEKKLEPQPGPVTGNAHIMSSAFRQRAFSPG